MKRLYGRKPRTFRPEVPHLSAMRKMRGIQLPPLADSVHNRQKLPTGNLGYMLNDRAGDCTCAGVGHLEQVVTGVAQGTMVTPTDAAISDAYQGACGWDGVFGDASDAGGNEQDVLTWMANVGLLQPDGTRLPIAGFVEVDPRALLDVREVIQECGAAYIGFDVPNDLPEDAGAAWDACQGAIEGGHCVILPGFGNPQVPTFDVISWGDDFVMTEAFWHRYVDECYGIIHPKWIEANGRTPWGLSFEQLQGLMGAIRRS